MSALDLVIIFAYLGGICALGVYFTRRQKTTKHYFTGDRSIPPWAIAASIVATETSTVTFISIPGVAFLPGGNFQFLQLVLGYLVGRIVVTLLFIPSYFRGDLLTVYQLLNRRFGAPARMVAASLFVVMRNVADGIRMLLTAFVLAAVVVAFRTDADFTTALVGSILLLTVVMILFTYYGGIEAVVWVEVLQLGIYLAGAVAAAWVLAAKTPGGFQAAVDLGRQYGKFSVFDFAWNAGKTYTFWAGLVGGCFLTMSTHGTDQYMVQRYLCTDRPAKAGAALLASGVAVLVQFTLFLFIGVLLFAFYETNPAAKASLGSVPGDRVFPHFITNYLPPGLAGLVVAAIFAAALSSSLSAISSTVVNDLYRPLRPARDDVHYLRVSKLLVFVFGLVQMGVALALIRTKRSAVDQVLGVAGLVNGPVLGLFLVGSMSKRVTQIPALIGMLVSVMAMTLIWWFYSRQIAWPWYPLIGSTIVVVIGLALAPLFPKGEPKDQRGFEVVQAACAIKP